MTEPDQQFENPYQPPAVESLPEIGDFEEVNDMPLEIIGGNEAIREGLTRAFAKLVGAQVARNPFRRAGRRIVCRVVDFRVGSRAWRIFTLQTLGKPYLKVEFSVYEGDEEVFTDEQWAKADLALHTELEKNEWFNSMGGGSNAAMLRTNSRNVMANFAERLATAEKLPGRDRRKLRTSIFDDVSDIVGVFVLVSAVAGGVLAALVAYAFRKMLLWRYSLIGELMCVSLIIGGTLGGVIGYVAGRIYKARKDTAAEKEAGGD